MNENQPGSSTSNNNGKGSPNKLKQLIAAGVFAFAGASAQAQSSEKPQEGVISPVTASSTANIGMNIKGPEGNSGLERLEFSQIRGSHGVSAMQQKEARVTQPANRGMNIQEAKARGSELLEPSQIMGSIDVAAMQQEDAMVTNLQSLLSQKFAEEMARGGFGDLKLSHFLTSTDSKRVAIFFGEINEGTVDMPISEFANKYSLEAALSTEISNILAKRIKK